MKDNKISINIVKLVFIFLVFGLSLFLPVYLLNHYWLHQGRIFPIAIFLFPFISLFLTVVLKKGFKGFRSNLTSTKYVSFAPAFFYFDPGPKYYRFKNIAALEVLLEPDDVLLRRHDNYIDGLILGQTSYFTHAGIYHGKDKDNRFIVYDCVGSDGVSSRDLGDFAKCDDIAIVRFNPGLVEDEAWKNRIHNQNTTFFMSLRKSNSFSENMSLSSRVGGVFEPVTPPKEVSEMIEAEMNESNEKLKEIAVEELSMFDLLKNALGKTPVVISRQEVNDFYPEILKLSKALVDRKYDFTFNFTNDDTLSCVEYVWDCYKAFFPLHQIRRNDILYFNWVKTRVIVPDMFLSSEFFSLKYNSIDSSIGFAGDLLTKIKWERTNFWWVMLRIIIFQVIIALLVFATVR